MFLKKSTIQLDTRI